MTDAFILHRAAEMERCAVALEREMRNPDAEGPARIREVRQVVKQLRRGVELLRNTVKEMQP